MMTVYSIILQASRNPIFLAPQNQMNIGIYIYQANFNGLRLMGNSF